VSRGNVLRQWELLRHVVDEVLQVREHGTGNRCKSLKRLRTHGGPIDSRGLPAQCVQRVDPFSSDSQEFVSVIIVTRQLDEESRACVGKGLELVKGDALSSRIRLLFGKFRKPHRTRGLHPPPPKVQTQYHTWFVCLQLPAGALRHRT